MNREILFRGKTKKGNWYEGMLLWSDGLLFIESRDKRYYNVDPDTIGQYTGLIDRNGKKIFEGDILECTRPVDVKRVGAVKFGEHEKEVGFYVDFNDPNIRQDIGFWTHERDVKVIGNIYDNPELL